MEINTKDTFNNIFCVDLFDLPDKTKKIINFIKFNYDNINENKLIGKDLLKLLSEFDHYSNDLYNSIKILENEPKIVNQKIYNYISCLLLFFDIIDHIPINININISNQSILFIYSDIIIEIIEINNIIKLNISIDNNRSFEQINFKDVELLLKITNWNKKYMKINEKFSLDYYFFKIFFDILVILLKL